MRHFLLLGIYSILLLCLTAGSLQLSAANDTRPVKRVLMCVTHHMTDVWTERLSNAIRRNTEQLPYRLEYTIVALDAFRSPDETLSEKRFLDILPDIQAGKFSLIVTLDDIATDMVLKHASQWSNHIPVVFAGYECYTPEMKKQYPNLTGVTQNYDIEKTLLQGLEFYPNTKNIIILYDSSKASVEFASRAKKVMGKISGVRAEYINSNELSVSKLFEKLGTSQDDTLILMAPWRGLANNDYQNAVSFGLDLAKNNKRPYFTVNDTLLGFGALGGFGSIAAEDGNVAASLIARVLKNNSAVAIPVEQGKIYPVFDYNLLSEEHLNISKLPSGAVVLNRPISLWEHHQDQIFILCGLLLLFIAGAGFYLFVMRRSVKHTRELLDILPGEIGIAGHDETILYWKGNSAIHGTNAKSHFLKDLPDFDYNKGAAAIRKIFKDGAPATFEYESGSGSHAVSMVRIPKHLFGQEAVVWFALDNTELRRARREADEYAAKLRRSTKLWDLVINSLPIHVFAKNPDDNYKYVFCNKSMADFFGKTEAQMVGENDFALFEKTPAEEIRKLDIEIMDGSAGRPEQTAAALNAKGEIRSLRGIKKAFVDDDGSRLLFGIAVDITELENLKRISDENAEWFRRTLNSIGDGVITTDDDGKIVMINPVAERMMECRKEDVVGKPHESVFHIERYDDGAPAPSPVTRTLRTGTIVELANHTDLISSSGKRYHISDSAAPIFSKEGKIIGAILVFRDVTEEYIRRDTLRNTVSLMEAGADLTKSACFIYDVNAKKMTGSKLLPSLWPVHNGNIGTLSGWVVPEDHGKLIDAWRAIIQGKSDSILVDYRVEKDGELRYHRLKSYVEERKFGVLKTFGVIQDITEISSATRTLRESTEMWEQVINLLPVMICVKDFSDLRYTLCNKPFAAFLGRTQEEVIGKRDPELLRDAKDAEEIIKHDRLAEENGGSLDYHETVGNADGEKIHLSTIKRVVTIGDRKLLLAATSDISDLTHRIEAEQLNSRILGMTVREENFDTILEYIGHALLERMHCERIVLANPDADNVPRLAKEWHAAGLNDITDGEDDINRVWSLKNAQIFACAPNTMSNDQKEFSSSEVKKNSHFTSRAMLLAPIEVSGKIWGTLFAAHINSTHAFSEIDDNLFRTCADVIALAELRRRQAAALHQSDLEKQMVLDNIRIPIWLFNGRGELIRVNNEVRKMENEQTQNGYSGVSMEKSPDLHPEFKVIRTLQSTEEKIHWNGRDLMVNAEPVFNDARQLTYIVKSAFDVTELNTLLRQQQLSQFSLEVFFREDNLEKALRGVMEKICDFLNASRLFLIQLDAKKHVFGTCLEYSPDNQTEIFNLKGVSFDPSARWYRNICGERMVAVPDLSRAEDAGTVGEWRQLFSDASICSVYSIALHCGNELWGNLGILYEKRKRDLNDSEKNFLQTVARQVNLLLQKQASKQALLKALEDTRASERTKEAMLQNEKTINNCLQALFAEENTERAIHTVLATMREHFDAARCYIVQLTEDGAYQYVNHEESISGAVPVFEKKVKYPIPANSTWGAYLNTHDCLQVTDVFDEKHAAELAGSLSDLRQADVRSIFIARIRMNGHLWGCFNLMYQGKAHGELLGNELVLLTSAARMIEIMLQRQKSRDEIVRAMELAQAADKAKSYFIASVSHEIRTPLNAVLGFSELLRDGNVPEKDAKEYLNSIAVSGNALLQLINDVLDLSKLEANQMEIVTEPVNFGKMVSDIACVFTPRAAARGVAVKVAEMQFPNLKLDTLRIRQILFNLLGNAVKFTKQGSITVSASFQPTEPGFGKFYVSVADTGIGISAEDQHRLMKPFVQLSQMRGTNTQNSGTGLGLAISKRLVEKMGGTLRVKSELGKGSTFEVLLEKVELAAGKPSGLPAAAQNVSPVKAGAISLLLVDDVPMNLMVMSALCRKAGVRDIVTAGSGTEALKLLKTRKFTLIMTDMWMPEMNGSELAKEIRANSAFDDIPVIAVTADVEVKDNFSLQHFSEILFKPVTLAKIQEVLKKYSFSH